MAAVRPSVLSMRTNGRSNAAATLPQLGLPTPLSLSTPQKFALNVLVCVWRMEWYPSLLRMTTFTLSPL